MSLPFIFIWTSGLPRIPRFVTMRELVSEHLEWERRAGAPPPEEDPGEVPAAGDPQDDGGEPDAARLVDGLEADEEPPASRSEAETRELLAAALLELLEAWQSEVVDNVPSQLLLGLCGFADRAAYLLEDLVPGHAVRFARLRDLLMDHTQGGRRLPDEELHRVAAEVEATFKEFLPEEAPPA